MPVLGQFSTIFPDVTIGDGTRVGNFVMIRTNTLIGDGCTIGPTSTSKGMRWMDICVA